MIPTPDEVLAFWFGAEGEDRTALWFSRDDAFDREIRDRFGALHDRAARDELFAWAETPRGRLALLLVLDQFSRNLYRDDPRAFAQDESALGYLFDGLERGDDRALSLTERWFFYMPLMHAEDLAIQERGIELYTQLRDDAPDDLEKTFEGVLDFARRHRDVVARFGRFPHRNAVLGRETTAEEAEFLAAGKPF
jgi:uncharacterized protein (DUF924 family)